MWDREAVRYSLLLALLGSIFYVSFLGGVHLFDWDEINFAEISREMLITKEYTRVYVDFLPFWEKPPFFFWLQASAMSIFGVNEFAARLPNAICGILTLVVLFNIGRRLYNTRFGLIWAGVYFGTILPFLYFKSGIIDPWFNLFIFLGIYYFILFHWKRNKYTDIELPRSYWTYLIIGGLSIGMGILTKGQVAYLLAGLTFFVYWVIYARFRFYVNVPQFIVFTLAATLVTLGWYGIETWKNGTWFITEFNRYQYRLFSTPDAGHRGFPFYHFVVLLIGCFPASVFLIRSFGRIPGEEAAYHRDFRIWMKILFWVVLILFSIVKSKIVHYSSMTYYPLTYLAAYIIYNMVEGKIKMTRWMRIGLWTIGGLFILATVSLPFLAKNIELIKPLFSKDPFALANLEAAVNWTGFEIIPGLFLLVVLFLALRWWKQERYQNAIPALFGGTAVFVMLTLVFFINRIEGYSQRAAIEFFESKVGKDAYLLTDGYKSYAQYFYGKTQEYSHKNEGDREKLYTGDVDKDVYIVTKIHKADRLRQIPTLEEIGEKNGFVFFRRVR
ncbi:MAG: glycosyltransferase family 39 protein [Saprospiraceae bacterium]|nr:glycosyltransferase family 39 protein [Lewinella sp.]